MGKIDCSLVLNFFKEKDRMCAQYDCSICEATKRNINCLDMTQELVDLVQDWSDKHPRKTYADDFFEKHPNAPKNKEGMPTVSWCGIYGDDCCVDFRKDCSDCWNTPLGEEP